MRISISTVVVSEGSVQNFILIHVWVRCRFKPAFRTFFTYRTLNFLMHFHGVFLGGEEAPSDKSSVVLQIRLRRKTRTKVVE